MKNIENGEGFGQWNGKRMNVNGKDEEFRYKKMLM